MKQFIPLSVPNLRGNELEYITNAVQEEWVSTAGFCITEFENKIAEYVGAKRAVACQSGTAGIHLALLACGIGKGDEVIVPTLTFVAAVNPVKYAGAEPVFMDCDDSLTLDSNKLESFLIEECEWKEGFLLNKSSKRRVKAIIVVHVFGNMADMERILELGKKFNLKIIEDATEALGTYYKDSDKVKVNSVAGTMGDVGVYSFNGNKIITTGGGGMVVTNNDDYADRIKYLSTQAKDDSVYFIHNDIGYNYRMTNLQAAMGLAQLEQLESFIKIKKENFNQYLSMGVELIKFRENVRSNYWFYSYQTTRRDELIQYLEQNQIQSRPVWKLIHMLEPYKNNQSYRIDTAQHYYRTIVNIPCSTNLEKDDVQRVVECIKEFERS